VLVAISTCLRSIYIVELAAIVVVVCKDVLAPAVPIPRVNVAELAAVLVIQMLETTVVVDAGTV
jgi:hypothetical protein